MKLVDLFAGCGGMSLGFHNQGYKILAAYENWKPALECYKANFEHPIYDMDLSEVDNVIAHLQQHDLDVIIGGPPCQDFSHAGKRKEADRADLTISFASIVAGLRPLAFVMENVDRIRNSSTYQVARSIFTEAGYGLTEIVLDASLCGVPQRRKRFFSVGILGAADETALPLFLEGQASQPLTVRDYFGDQIDFDCFYRHPRNYSRRGIFSIDEPSPTIRGVNRPIPKGYPGHHNDACPVSEDVHVLTTEERAWIQTFPKDFLWLGTKTDKEQMIGNAVPVKLAEYVAKTLKQALQLQEQLLVTS